MGKLANFSLDSLFGKKEPDPLHELAHGVVVPVASTAAGNVGSQIGATPFLASMTGLKDKITDSDLKIILDKVNKERLSSGQSPVLMSEDFDKTSLGRMLRDEIKKRNLEMAELPPEQQKFQKFLAKLSPGSDPEALVEKFRSSPGHMVDLPGSADIYRNPKTPFGARGSTLAHELGHAAGKPGLLKKLQRLRGVSPMLLATGLGSYGYAAGNDDPMTPGIGIPVAAATAIGGVGSLATLLEEARATRNARKELKLLGKKPVGLNRAYMTYLMGTLLGGGAAAGAGYGLGKLRESSRK